MSIGSVTLTIASSELTRSARTLALELVARVASTGPQVGRGTIALAGLTLPARLPAGVEAGHTLRMAVVRVEPGQLTMRIVTGHEPATAGATALAHAAGRLAVSGDGDMMATALALANGQPLWLPDGRAATVAVRPDEDGVEGGKSGEAAGVAAFCLHSPTLGAIEVRLTMAGGTVRAGVVTAPGEAAGRATAALGELTDGLARATGRSASAAVTERAPHVEAPAPPAGRIDVQA